MSRLAPGQTTIFVNGPSCPVVQLKPNWPTRPFLPNSRTIHRVATWGNVIDADSDDIAATQLAVDCQIEKRQIPLLALYLEPHSDRPDVARAQRWLSTDKLALVPRHSGWLCE